MRSRFAWCHHHHRLIPFQTIDKSLAEMGPEQAAAAARVATWDEKVVTINSNINKYDFYVISPEMLISLSITDDLFGDFCKSIGVATLREYEEKILVEVKARLYWVFL